MVMLRRILAMGAIVAVCMATTPDETLAQTGTTGSDEPVGEVVQLLQAGKTDEAVKRLTDLADRGNIRATYLLGVVNLRQDKTKTGLTFLETAAERGHVRAAMLAARIRYDAKSPYRDVQAALDLLRTAAERGDPAAQVRLAGWLIDQDTDTAYREAIQWLTVARVQTMSEKRLASGSTQNLAEIYPGMEPDDVAQAKAYAEQRYGKLSEKARSERVALLSQRLDRVETLLGEVRARATPDQRREGRSAAFDWLRDGSSDG